MKDNPQPPLMAVLPRLHDLPPLWNGHRVDWGDWHTTTIVMCPPLPLATCGSCGDTRNVSPASIGTVYPLAGETYETDRVRRSRRTGREYVAGTTRARVRPHMRLIAFRCPGCASDSVYDRDTHEWWDLDDSDYGDDGSVAP